MACLHEGAEKQIASVLLVGSYAKICSSHANIFRNTLSEFRSHHPYKQNILLFSILVIVLSYTILIYKFDVKYFVFFSKSCFSQVVLWKINILYIVRIFTHMYVFLCENLEIRSFRCFVTDKTQEKSY